METKAYLKKRRSELKQQLKDYQKIVDELAEVEAALDALEYPKDEQKNKRECKGCSGCDICRQGWDYR